MQSKTVGSNNSRRPKKVASSHFPKNKKTRRRTGEKHRSNSFPSSFALLRHASLLAQGPLAPADAAQVRFALFLGLLRRTEERHECTQRWKPPSDEEAVARLSLPLNSLFSLLSLPSHAHALLPSTITISQVQPRGRPAFQLRQGKKRVEQQRGNNRFCFITVDQRGGGPIVAVGPSIVRPCVLLIPLRIDVCCCRVDHASSSLHRTRRL